jgi:hypothetical protein
LCYSSTLFATLRQEYYNPSWTNMGLGSDSGIFSLAVKIFQDENLNNLPLQRKKWSRSSRSAHHDSRSPKGLSVNKPNYTIYARRYA